MGFTIANFAETCQIEREIIAENPSTPKVKIGRVFAVSDIVKKLNHVMNEKDEIPANNNLISQNYYYLKMLTLRRYLVLLTTSFELHD